MYSTDQPYTRFEDEKTSEAPLSTRQPEQAVVSNQKPLGYRPLKRSVIAGIIASFAGLSFGIARLVAVTKSNYKDLDKLHKYGSPLDHGYASSLFGAEIWVPIMGIIAAGFGLDALRLSNYKRSCFPSAHLVFCIIGAVTAFVLVVSAIVAVKIDSALLHEMPLFKEDAEVAIEEAVKETDAILAIDKDIPGVVFTVTPPAKTALNEIFMQSIATVLTFEILIVLAAVIMTSANIASSFFIYRYFSRKQSSDNADPVTETPTEFTNGITVIDNLATPLGMQVEYQSPTNQATVQRSFQQETLFTAP